MLISLSIKNYALIEDIQVNFGNGLTIITGETGAGKSILLGALSLILGKRADLSSVKNSSKKCIVEATFDIANYNLKSIFDDQDIDYESQTIIRREILTSGKSRAFVNDSPVNLDILAALGERLIDIHSQHQSLELTDNEFQFQIIDALANNESFIQSYQELHVSYKDGFKKLQDLNNLKAEALKEQDYNNFLLTELQKANLTSGELYTLEEEQQTLSNVEFIRETLNQSNQLISEDQIGILQTLSMLNQSLKSLSNISSIYTELYQRSNSSFIELNDLFSEIEKCQENLTSDPERLIVVNTKLQIIHNLLKKHTASDIDELIKIKEDLSQKIDAFETIDHDIIKIQNTIDTLEKELHTLALQIHLNRKKAIPELSSQLVEILVDLGMPNAKFDISIDPIDNFLHNGKDELAFLFTANKGDDFKALKKAASGGELSRIMLAIKSILAKYSQLPTIIFDEIDTGVSGEISNKMADIMKRMSSNMQVFTITHLPQIAAKGDTHFKVFKEDNNDQTSTHLTLLNADERIVELAEMLGGKQMSNSAIAHAKQLLN